MIVEELVTKLGLEIDGDVLSTLEKFKSAISKGLGGVTVAAAAAAAALAGVVGTAAHAADEIGDVADRLKVAPQALQELKFAADRSEASFEDLQLGLKFLAKNAVEAANGSKEMAAAFAGIQLRGADGKVRNSTELLADLADKVKDLGDAEGLNLASRVLGKGGDKLLPLLRRGSAGIAELSARAHELGLVFSDTDVAAAGRLDDALKDVRDALTGLRNQLGAQFFEAVAAGLELMSDAIVGLLPYIKAIGEGILVAGDVVAFTAGFFVGAWEEVAKKLGLGNAKLEETGDHLQTIQNIVTAITLLFTGRLLIGALSLVRFLIPSLGTITTLFNGIAFSIGALSTALGIGVLPTLGLIAGVVALIGFLAYDLYKLLTGQEPIIFNAENWKEVGRRIKAIGELIVNTFTFVWAQVAELFGKAIMAAVNNIPFLKPLLNLLDKGISKGAEALGVGGIYDAVKGTVKNAVGLGPETSLSDSSAQGITDAFNSLTAPWKGGASGPDAAGAISSSQSTSNQSVQTTNNFSINASQMDERQLVNLLKTEIQTQNQDVLASFQPG